MTTYCRNLPRTRTVLMAALAIFAVVSFSSASNASMLPNGKSGAVRPVAKAKHKKVVKKLAMLPMPAPEDPCVTPCPTDFPPTSIPFNGPFAMYASPLPNGCYCKICYCTRQTSPGNNDIVITEIACWGGGCEDDIAGTVDQAYAYLHGHAHDSMHLPCPLCNATDTTSDTIQNYYNEVRGSCWHAVAPGTDPATGQWNGFYHDHIMMCEAHYWCMTPYRVCCDEDGTEHMHPGATVRFGDPIPCDPDCIDIGCTR